MRITEGVLERGDLTTWYQVCGELDEDGGRAPVVVCHGGPGMTHDYLSSLSALAESGRPVVFYDQFGSGRSGHRRDADAGFWTVPLFLRELTDLIAHLGIDGVEDVRVGKYMEITMREIGVEEARRRLEEACRRLLANTVIEEYRIEIGG